MFENGHFGNIKRFKSILLGKEAKESQVPSDIAEKIDQIRSCTRIHAEISDEDSNVIPESCYDPVEAELKFAALESKFSWFSRRLPVRMFWTTCPLIPCQRTISPYRTYFNDL